MNGAAAAGCSGTSTLQSAPMAQGINREFEAVGECVPKVEQQSLQMDSSIQEQC